MFEYCNLKLDYSIRDKQMLFNLIFFFPPIHSFYFCIIMNIIVPIQLNSREKQNLFINLPSLKVIDLENAND